MVSTQGKNKNIRNAFSQVRLACLGFAGSPNFRGIAKRRLGSQASAGLALAKVRTPWLGRKRLQGLFGFAHHRKVDGTIPSFGFSRPLYIPAESEFCHPGTTLVQPDFSSDADIVPFENAQVESLFMGHWAGRNLAIC